MSGIQIQMKEWSMVVVAFFESLLRKLGTYAPNLFGAILILLIGFMVAKLMRGITRKLLKVTGFVALGEKVKFNEVLKKTGIEKGIDEIMAVLVYYVVILVFIVSASEILGMNVVLDTLNRFIAYLPHVLGAFIILVITLFVAKFVKDTVNSALSNLNVGSAGIASSSLEVLIVAFGILIALSELGFDISVFMANITIIIAGIVLSVVLSVGLGSRAIMSNILARYYIHQLFSIGDEVLLGGQKGQIVKITPVSVVLKTGAGEELHIPNERIIRDGSTVLKQGESEALK